MIITAFNPSTDDLEKTYLSNSISSGATQLAVKNVDRFAANDRIMIGEMGREKTEIVTVSSVSGGGTIVTGATVFSHSADDPVYKLRFDQVKFYRSTTGSGGTYTLVDTENLDVDNENLTTIYDDTSGVSTYYYEVSYYHSISTLESTVSDPVLGSGYPRGSAGFLIDEIVREVGDTELQYVSRPEIIAWFNEVNDDLMTRSRRPFKFLFKRTTEARTADATTLAFPTDMWKFDRMDYVFTDANGTTSTYPVRVKSLQEFRETYGDSSGGDPNDELQFIALDEATDAFRLWPRSDTSASNVFYIYYYKVPTEIDSEGDVFETDTPDIYKQYALHKFYLKKSTSDPNMKIISDTYERKYERCVANLKRAGSKDVGSPLGMKYNPQDYKGNRRF